MAVTLLQRFASGAPAPMFVLAVGRGRRLERRLHLEDGLRVVDSPRHASILVVTSPLPEPVRSAARLVHDQMPHPRAVVTLAATDEIFPRADHADRGDLTETVREVYEALCRGERPSTQPLMPEQNPVEWRGVGPHGQGGEGMMGGKPYGRRMAMVGEEIRDGLMLTRLTVTLGPFLPWLPPGLELAVDLQGDVIQS
ncbi:MAG: hypothetical protein ABEK29_08170, partial [Bradymonadaceae bacterium]